MAFPKRLTVSSVMMDVIESLKKAITEDDLPTIQQFLDAHPESATRIDDGLFPWGMPALAGAQSEAMVDLLLGAGATVEAVSNWWAPGFGASQVSPERARSLITRGASLSPHAAAGIGLLEELSTMLKHDPDCVRAPGGDGCHPLHFAQSVEIASLLVDHGADLNARDEDHHSTPMQWRIKDAPEVVRFLLEQGAEHDIFLAAALGDHDLAREILAKDPTATQQRIGYNKGAFPGIGNEGRGGTIYQWTLGFNRSPHEVALKQGHESTYELLLEHTPPRHQLLVACTSANRPLAESLIEKHPQLVEELDEEDQTLLAKFCWETNLNLAAVELMLDLGFPIDVPEPNHGFMALHNAAWCGDPELVKLLIERGHPLDRRDPGYQASALGYAVHSCTKAKRHPEGKFAQVVELLVTAGVPVDDHQYPSGDAEIDAVLKRLLA